MVSLDILDLGDDQAVGVKHLYLLFDSKFSLKCLSSVISHPSNKSTTPTEPRFSLFFCDFYDCSAVVGLLQAETQYDVQKLCKNSASNKMYRISFTAIFFYLAVKIKASCMTNTRSCTSNPKKIKFLRILDFISHKVILQTCPAGTNPHEFSENKRTCNVTQVKWKYKFNLK